MKIGNMIISEDKKFLLWFRKITLELLASSLRCYGRWKDQEFLDHAKEFGQRSLEIKNKLKLYE